MYRNTVLFFALVVASHMCLANPLPEPEPYKTHLKIHVPYTVHSVHHHHVKKVPIIHHVPVIKEVPIIKTVPIIETIPVVKTVYLGHGWH